MGTWTLWIAFNTGVALLLALDLALFHRRTHAAAWREAAIESAAWVGLSLGFGAWIFVSQGRGPGLEFFTGYVIEKSLSVDNVFVFLLIFQYFRVEPRHQHRLLIWGVLGALVLRGAMIGAGVILITRYERILYLFGAFLMYAGFKLIQADPSVHPEKNPIVRWTKYVLPMSDSEAGQKFWVRQGGRFFFTPLFIVVIVLETTDLALAMDSIPAVFGVTRDPFLVYSSNVCAILGLRAFYFLLAGILPYFRSLDKGLGVVLVFIGGKMLAEPWFHISTGHSLAIVGAVIGAAVMVSIFRARPKASVEKQFGRQDQAAQVPPSSPETIGELADGNSERRAQAARILFYHATMQIAWALNTWRRDEILQGLMVQEWIVRPRQETIVHPRLTVGIAVWPDTFEKIRVANGSPPLAAAPADQDVLEFELEFPGKVVPHVRLDVLTTKTPDGGGAIDRFLKKFGEGIQQVEIDVTDVDSATDILRNRFELQPIFPATRTGANGTRMNFFLVKTWDSKKALVELVEQPKGLQPSQAANR